MTVQLPPQADMQRRLRRRPGRAAVAVVRPFFGLLTVLDGVAVGLAGHAVWHARNAVGPRWAVAVAAGLAFPPVLIIAAWLARRRRLLTKMLWWAVALATGNGASLIGVPLTHAWQAGVTAMTLPAAVHPALPRAALPGGLGRGAEARF